MMSAYTLTDALSFSHLNALPTVYRSETASQPQGPQSLYYLVIGYTAGSALTTAPQHFGRWEDMLPNYQPKTELGEKLLALRRAYIEKGGRLLSADELEEELRARRGRVGDA